MLDLLKNKLNVKVLGKEQMLNVSGGKSCAAYWPDRTAETLNSCSFEADVIHGSGNSVNFYGVSAQDAQCLAASKPGGRWCCDSCSSASWY